MVARRIYLGLVLILGSAATALPQTEFSQQKLPACADDMRAYCANVPSASGRAVHCLQENQAKVAASCNDALAAPSDYAGPDGGVSLTVTISGIRSDEGFVWLALAGDSKTFPRGRRAIVVPAQGGSVVVTFRHLKPNRYAVLAYHDANDNGTMDKDAFGLPTEGGCFSNNVSGFPSFRNTAVTVAQDTEIKMTMNYR